jgi:hypothetical protein
MGLGCLFKPAFWGLTLRHRNAVTWTFDQHTWFSFIYIAITLLQQQFRVSVLSFLSWYFSLAGCLLPYSVKQRVAFQLSLF